MRDVVVAGVGMTRFGRFLERGLASLTAEAVNLAIGDAGTTAGDIQSVYFSNVVAGLITGQESTRGQHSVSGAGLGGIPLVNVENACASGSTAVHQAWLAVASGYVDVAIAVGAEKLYCEDKSLSIAVMRSAIDQERIDDIVKSLGGGSADRSIFMDVYAALAGRYARESGATTMDFARVSAKNHDHGALNPKAQYHTRFTVQEILEARSIVGPLTLPMCAPIGDGAAAAIIATPDVAARWGADPVRLLATILEGGEAGSYGTVVPGAAQRAYEQAGLGPTDLDVIECHDATAPAELIVMEELGICAPGDAPKLVRAGARPSVGAYRSTRAGGSRARDTLSGQPD